MWACVFVGNNRFRQNESNKDASLVVVVDGCCCCCCCCCCGGGGGGGGGVLQGSHQKRGSNIPKAVNLAELGPTEASKYVTNSVS